MVLSVYLDNSDYSVLSNPNIIDKQPELIKIRDKLKKLVNDKSITIKYSATNVMELVHRNEDSREFALSRAKLLKELAGNNAVIRCEQLYFQEALAYVIGQPFNKDIISAEDNNWFGVDADELIIKGSLNLISEFKKVLKEKNQLNRNQRRTFLRAYLTHQGKLTPAAIELLKPHWEKTEKDSLMLIFEQGILDFCCGKISEEDLAKCAYSTLNDVEALVAKIIDYTPKVRQDFIDFVMNYGKVFLDAFEGLQCKVAESEILYDQITDKMEMIYLESVRDVRNQISLGWFDDNEAILNGYGVNKKFWKDKLSSAPIGFLPALDTFLLASIKSVYGKLVNRQKLKINDVRDFMHASYAPYCDIFRADKKTGNLLQNIGKDFLLFKETTIVRKIEDIVGAIDDKLQVKKAIIV